MDRHSPNADALDTSRAARKQVFESVPSDLPTIVHHGCYYASGDQADAPVFTHVHQQVGQHDRLSFGELDQKARAIAAEIQSRGGAGKPVLIVLDPGNDYAAALYGCLYARAIAVPVYPPQMLRLQHTLSRLQAIIENAGAKLMLSSRSIIGDSLGPIWNLPNDAAIAVDEINLQQSSEWDEVPPAADDVAILQYTSGSTGNPQGVVLRHRAILSNLRALLNQFHFPNVRCVQWVPPYHDMGLVGGILVPVYVGVETIILSPTDFVRDPLLWLQCIDHYRGTSNGAPNFGYELCIRKIKEKDCEGLDLSSWKVAIAGAEPVRQGTLKRFSEKFAPFGFDPTAFSPAYGLAETTLIVAGSQVGTPYNAIQVDSRELQKGSVLPSKADDTLTLVSSGDPVLGMEIEIVDPDTRRLAEEGKIGEIWVRGGSLADGYWNEPNRTAESFNATIIDGEHDDYLRTGDLGVLIDGELFVTGRRKELIIIAGKNLYPHDVEELVQGTSPAFKPAGGTAFGIETDEGEQLVVVQEITRPKKFCQETLLRGAVSELLSQLQVTPHAVVLVRSGSLPKTSSGKLRRRDVRQAFLDNELQEVCRWQGGHSNGSSPREIDHVFEPPATPTECEIAIIWQQTLGIDSIGRKDDFFHLGGSSLLVSQMTTAVNENLDIDLPLHVIFHHPTLEGFAKIATESGPVQSTPIQRNSASDDQHHRLSSAQQRLWLLSQLEQTNAFLNVPVSVKLSSKVDRDALEQAIRLLIQKHAVLRTSIVENASSALQTIHADVPFQLQILSLDTGELKEFQDTPFDLQTPPLMRAAVTPLPSGDERIDFVFHHIICDASSVAILLEDLQSILNGDTKLAHGDLRYVDYAAWECGEGHSQSVDNDFSYWADRLRDLPSHVQWPVDSAMPHETSENTVAGREPKGDSLSLSIGVGLADKIKASATQHGATASMVFLTALQTVLSKYCNTDDIGILIPTSNRPAATLEPVVGCYVNPIVYRAEIDSAFTVQQALRSTRNALLEDLEHADVPFQSIVDQIDHDRSVDRMPLAQTMFLYQPSLRSIDALGDATVTSVTPDYSAVTAYDLSLIVHPTEEGFEAFVLHGNHCHRNTAERIARSLESVIRELVAELLENTSDKTLADLQIPAQAEQEIIERSRHGRDLDLGDESVLTRLRHHASANPTSIAVEDDGGAVSFEQLESQSSQFAQQLLLSGVTSESLVGVQLPRSCDLTIVILGIWKAGAAYVPLSDDLPQSRLADIVNDADVSLVIDSEKLNELRKLKSPSAEGLSLPSRFDLAYVIYTSGSTGKPKGVAIEHHSVANLLASFQLAPGFGDQDSLLALTTLSFDISVLELFLPIWCGGRCRITAHTLALNPEKVSRTIAQSDVTHIQATPSSLRVLLASGWRPTPGLVVYSGGEPLTQDIAKELLTAGCVLWNVYGPTETTVWSSIQEIDDDQDITIGTPVANTTMVVADQSFNGLPVGVAGELCIGGEGLAREYLNLPELTRQKFVSDGGLLLYRTGDQARVRGDGKIEFLARNDRQVKLRGFRIELDEIESVTQQHEHVHRAAVVMDNRIPNRPQIIAFCQFSPERDSAVDVSVDALQQFVAKRLPAYMLPVITSVQEIPQTSAGKTDYRALSLELPTSSTNLGNTPPESPLECLLADEWCDVLGAQQVGRFDNFFQIGGNSLLAAQLFARLRTRLNIDLPLREVYEKPTIALLADYIVQQQSLDQPKVTNEILDQIENLSDEEALLQINQIISEAKKLDDDSRTSQ